MTPFSDYTIATMKRRISRIHGEHRSTRWLAWIAGIAWLLASLYLLLA